MERDQRNFIQKNRKWRSILSKIPRKEFPTFKNSFSFKKKKKKRIVEEIENVGKNENEIQIVTGTKYIYIAKNDNEFIEKTLPFLQKLALEIGLKLLNFFFANFFKFFQIFFFKII